MASAYIVNNLISDSSVAISASSEDSVYPLEYLYDQVLGKPFRFTVLTGGWIEIDFATATAFDTVGVLNHNFAASAYVLVQAGASSPPTTGLAAPAWREANIWANPGSQNYRYVRLLVNDANSAATEIGELVIGVRTVLPRARRYGGQPYGRMRANIAYESTRGRNFNYKLFQKEHRVYSWRVLEEELEDFLDFDDAVKGNVQPFLWIPDTDGAEAFYARMVESDFKPTELDNIKAYDVTITLAEESRGVAILA